MVAWLGRLLALVCVIGLAQTAYDAYSTRSRTKACHALQRKLQQDIDNLGSANVDAPMDDIFGRLVAAGALSGQMGRSASGAPAVIALDLEDPGQGPGSFRDFVLMAGSRTIGCTVHGSAFLAQP